MSKACILVEQETREELRNFGRKGQTYDQIIQSFIESRKSIVSSHAGTHSHGRKFKDSGASLEHTLEPRNP